MPRSNAAARLGPLLSDVARILRTTFDRSLRDLGLTQTQWRALLYVSRSEGMHQAALAEVLEVAPISLTRLIDRMEAAGWVERRRDPEDRRAVQLYLTPQVQGLLDEINLRAEAMRDVAFRGLPTAEVEVLETTLLKIKSNLSKAGACIEPAN